MTGGQWKDDGVPDATPAAAASRYSGGLGQVEPGFTLAAGPSSPTSGGRSFGVLRLAIVACAASAMLAGFWIGLGRLGWELPHAAAFASLHGPLLISGVFGTLVALERAVASGGGWSLAAPALSVSGSVLLLAGMPVTAGAGAYVLAAAILTGASLVALWRQPAAFSATLVAGAAAWLTGSALWAYGSPVPDVAGWWLAFLVLTVAGERLEISRLVPQSRLSLPLFLGAISALLLGACAGLFTSLGACLSGLGLLALTAWLIRHDIALRTVHQAGQARFMAMCMLAGYAWLGAAGILLLAVPPATTAFGYDMAIHAVLLGFALSMVFGHALIILPAVADIHPRFGRALYLPLATLHASVALRVASDLLGTGAGRQWSGLVTVAAVAGFAACIARSTRGTRSHDARTGS